MAAGAGAWVRPFRDGHRVYFRREPGSVLQGSRVFPTEEAAEALADELRAQINTKRRTIAGAIDDYKTHMETRGLSDKTRTEVYRNLRRIFDGVLDSPMAVLTPRRADALHAALVGSGQYAPGTRRLLLANARTFATWCAHPRRRWLKSNVFAGVEAIGEAPDHRSESLRVDEARALREKALAIARGGDYSAIMVLLVLGCSINPSEVIQIDKRDVDDDGAVLWIAGDRLKTKNRRRPIDIADPELRALLVRAAAGKAPEERLFTCTRQHVTTVCKRVATAAGLPATTARELRRTFASITARRGSSLDELAFAMGHGADASARTAQRHYVAPGAVQSGAAKRALSVLDGGKARKRVKRSAD